MGYAQRRQALRRRRRYWLLAELTCIALLAVLLALIAMRLAARKRISNEEAAAAALMNSMPSASSQPSDAPPEIQAELLPLLAQNPDTVGLLRFGEDRTLYVCQADDNVYYMDHRFNGSEDPAGMIYMDCRNTLLPRSDNLILYGHNMADGSRFGTLKRYMNIDFLLQHPVFTLADLYETVDYVPFSVFTTTVLTEDPAYFPFDRTDFADAADFDAWIAEARSRSLFYLPGDVQYGARLLTFATCSADREHGRLVILCRAKEEA